MKVLPSSETAHLEGQVVPELLQAEPNGFVRDDQLLIAFWSFEGSLPEAIARYRHRPVGTRSSASEANSCLVEAWYAGHALFAAQLGPDACVVRRFRHAAAHFCPNELWLRARRAPERSSAFSLRAGVVHSGRAPTPREAWAESSFSKTLGTGEHDADAATLRQLREMLLRPSPQRRHA